MRQPVSRPLILTTDANYLPAACICLTSAFLATPDADFKTYIVTDEPGDELHRATKWFRLTFHRDVAVITVKREELRQFVVSLGHVSRTLYQSLAAFLRLLTPAMLPDESFLYLDCDMVVQDSLRPLLDLELGGWLAAAVRDGISEEESRLRLRFGDGEPYYNSGTMVVNARAWRKHNYLAKLRRLTQEPGRTYKLADQDLINVLCRDRILPLDERWNFTQHNLFFKGWDGFDPDAFRGIFHFTSAVKPWMAWCPPPARRLYERYASVSPLRMPAVGSPRHKADLDGVTYMALAENWRRRQRRP